MRRTKTADAIAKISGFILTINDKYRIGTP
jgi:hypothetical protein